MATSFNVFSFPDSLAIVAFLATLFIVASIGTIFLIGSSSVNFMPYFSYRLTRRLVHYIRRKLVLPPPDHSLQHSLGYALVGTSNWLRRALFRSSRMSSSSQSRLEPLVDVVQLSPSVWRVLGQNPGAFTLQGTNTYLVGTGSKKVLIDAGEPSMPAYLDKLFQTLDTNNFSLAAVIVTHWHHDHVGGVVDVLQRWYAANKKRPPSIDDKSKGSSFPRQTAVPVYKLRRTDGIPESTTLHGLNPENNDVQTIRFVDDGHLVRVFEGPDDALSDNNGESILMCSSVTTLRLVHTPGHTSDHCAVHYLEEGSLFSGDCVLGHGTAIFEDLHAYMDSLRKMLELDPTRIYPGHGPVIDTPKDRVLAYIEHREKRERDVVKTLAASAGRGLTPLAITNTIYKDVDWVTRIGALGNVQHHLAKLVKDGTIFRVDGAGDESSSEAGLFGTITSVLSGLLPGGAGAVYRLRDGIHSNHLNADNNNSSTSAIKTSTTDSVAPTDPLEPKIDGINLVSVDNKRKKAED